MTCSDRVAECPAESPAAEGQPPAAAASATDVGLRPPELLLTDIELLLLGFLECLGRGVLPEFLVPCTKRSAKRPLPLVNDTANPGLSHGETVGANRVSFVAKQGAGTYRFTRIVKMLTVVHELVRTGRSAPQRDLFYQLKGPPLFVSPRNVTDALEDVSALLGVSRSDLSVCASAKGIVRGRLLIHHREGTQAVDCSRVSRSIPGDCRAIQDFAFQTDARHVVVVEKDAVFQRLAEENFADATSSVLVTGKGMPDRATRLFLARLVAAFPGLTLAGVVDWNPCGVAILKTYKHGCGDGEVVSAAPALPGLRWLALHGDQVDGLPEDVFQPLTPHDTQVVKSLRAGPARSLEGWMRELDLMEANGVKAEIEAAYRQCGYGGFSRDLAARLQAGRLL